MKDSLIIKFLYNTMIGRLLLKALVNPYFSRALAKFLSSKSSKWLVPFFVYRHQIEMIYYQIPVNGFQSFNDFFTRSMKEKFIVRSDGELISPCDGLLTVANIEKDATFHIKHTTYSLRELLKSDELAEEYQGGTAFIFRLTPAHYHRYIWSTTGVVRDVEHIPGVLHSVQPICHEKTKVFVQNTREYTIINSASIGNVLQMEIGALLVGKITNYDMGNTKLVYAGQEKGFFEYGGSSIVVLIKYRTPLSKKLLNSKSYGNEIPICIGEKLTKY